MGGFDRKEPWNDPYSDRRWVTEHDRENLHDLVGRSYPHDRAEDEWKKFDEKKIHDYVVGPEGFAGTRIRAHYGDSADLMGKGLSAEERGQTVDLSTPDGRVAALSNMRQNADPTNPNGAMQCGAASLLGGAMYGGGNEGVSKLLNAMIQDHVKEKLRDPGKDQPWMDDDLKKIVDKLKDPTTKLTRGDLELISEKTYQHFQAEGLQGAKNSDPNDPLNAGLDGKKLNDFIGRHKDIQKMFKDNDMGLDSIDITGDGKGDHLVLGIGHQHDMTGEGGGMTRSMVFDPQARQNKEGWGDYMSSDQVDKIRWEERARMQGQFDQLKGLKGDAWEKKYDELQAELNVAVHKRQFEYKHDSQVITDQRQLNDYRKATDYEADGDKKVKDLKAQTKPENPYSWMF